METIPFNKPFIVGRELEYIEDAVRRGHIAGDGYYTRLCQEWMQAEYQVPRVFLTTSCTSALEMSALLCGIQPGDEIILPSFTYVSTASAFTQFGARLQFVDIREDTLNLDESLVEEAITDQTRAIVPAHYGGVSAEMDAILAVAGRHKLHVIEDAAQGVHASWKGKSLGSLGDLGTFSFHETKNYISGEGGALLLNREEWIERAETIRDKGTNRAEFFRGETDFYTWIAQGSSYLPSELVAAFLYAQLENADRITAKRVYLHQRYMDALAPLEGQGNLRRPVIPEACGHNGHLFYILLDSLQTRTRLVEFLRAQGIQTVFHYIPLHSSPMGRKVSANPDLYLPVTDHVSKCLLRLPTWYEMDDDQQQRVIDGIFKYFTS